MSVAGKIVRIAVSVIHSSVLISRTTPVLHPDPEHEAEPGSNGGALGCSVPGVPAGANELVQVVPHGRSPRGWCFDPEPRRLDVLRLAWLSRP